MLYKTASELSAGGFLNLNKSIPVSALNGVIILHPALNVYGGVFVVGVADNDGGNACVYDKALAH